MGLMPTFRVLADSEDVTAAIDAQLVSIRLTDEAGMAADTLEISLADDPASPIPIPRTGAELEVFMGYDGKAQRMGLYVADEVEAEGWPATMTVRARAAPYAATQAGKVGLQSQKSASWPKGTKLGDMVATIAKAHGLTPAVSSSLASVVLPHMDQTQESDLSFLVRVARRYDAFAKAAGGTLLVVKQGESKTASGASLATVNLAAADCSGYRLTIARRDGPGTVVAYWHDRKGAKRKEIKLGSGEPTRSLRHWFPTEAAAKAAAQAELDKRTRGEEQVSITTAGNPALIAESPLQLTGFRPGLDGAWLVTRVTHTLSKSGGYVCELDAERPNE